MDRQLKQRVVGAAILVALGVIFIPIFLDNGSDETRSPDVVNIPPPPDDDFASRVVPMGESDIEALARRALAPSEIFLDSEVVEPEAVGSRVEIVEPTTAPRTAPTSASETETARESKQKQVVKAPLELVGELPEPNADAATWTVQLGSFAKDANARTLIEKLRKGGYPGYLERRTEGANTIFKVRVGPHIQRAEAEQMRVQLEKEFSMKGIVVKYR
jgi:DedD protein